MHKENLGTTEFESKKQGNILEEIKVPQMKIFIRKGSNNGAIEKHNDLTVALCGKIHVLEVPGHVKRAWSYKRWSLVQGS